VPVKFTLDIDKVMAVAVYIASRKIPELTAGKLLKLMFLADKLHLVQHGRPITGETYAALKDGPVPKFTYRLLKQIQKQPYTAQAKQLAGIFTIDKTFDYPRISTDAPFDQDQLSRSDLAALDLTIKRFGHLTFTQLRALTHDMVAYENAWSNRGNKESVTMKFEDFFEEDEDAIAGTKDEVIENHILNTVFARR